jgi:pyrroline-5-carboxylate reductase
MSTLNKTIAFLGAGNMGEALIRGLLAAGTVEPRQIVAADVRADRLQHLAGKFGIRTGVITDADVIILAVKPQQMKEALASLPSTVKPLYISIAAGISTARIEAELGRQPRVIRVMPNTPALVGCGAAGLCPGRFSSESDMAVAETIMRAVGITVRVEESLMDAVTAVSGSGPAYVFLVVEAMIAAGVAQGLSQEVAARLVVQTVLGAGKLLAETGETPGELRRKVTSPGGTTEVAIKVMTERQLPDIFAQSIAAAAKRGRELSGG